MAAEEVEEEDFPRDEGWSEHDYCAAPNPSVVDLALVENKELREENRELRRQIEAVNVRQSFGLQRFIGSDDDIRLYTR